AGAEAGSARARGGVLAGEVNTSNIRVVVHVGHSRGVVVCPAPINPCTSHGTACKTAAPPPIAGPGRPSPRPHPPSVPPPGVPPGGSPRSASRETPPAALW